MTGLRAGIYQADLNPSFGLPIGGYYEPKRATRFHDRLYAKATSLRSGDARVLVASIDLVGLAKRTCDEIRDAMERKEGIPRGNVVLLCTHTHSGPETFSSNASLNSEPPDVPMRRELVENVKRMKAQIMFALEEAVRDERPVDGVTVSTAQVKGLYSNRNDPTRKIDRSLTMLRLKRDGAPVLFINHNCHPTVLGANNVSYSADFPAYLSRRLFQTLKAEQVSCVTGSCGDVSTRLTLGNEFSKRRNLKNAMRYGDELAELVAASARYTKPVKDLTLSASSKELKLKVKRHPDSSESEKLQRDFEMKIANTADATKRSSLEMALEGVKLWQETLSTNKKGFPATIGFDYGMFSLGDDFSLVWASGELLSPTGLKVKSSSRFGTTMISGYGNGDSGYIPPPEAYANLEYEAVVTPIQEGETEIIERELARLVSN